MTKPLWEFIDNRATFVSKSARELTSLYFPLCNNSIMSSLSPDLHGDIKTDLNSYLLEPVSRIDLANLKTSRNFWIYIRPQKIWSLTGVSKDIKTIKEDQFQLEAGLLWQKITRQNKRIGLKAEITSFVPIDEPVEIMRVDITNISRHPISFIPTAAIPIFARSANNLHDHRHVTSLLNRIHKNKFGVIVKPTLSFNESGHKKNSTSYFVLGMGEGFSAAEYIYPTQEGFTGEGSDLEAPCAIFNNLEPDKNHNIQGKEAMAGLRFKIQTLKPQKTHTYIVLMGIVKDNVQINHILHRFNTPDKIRKTFRQTCKFWQGQSSKISISSGDSGFDNWFRWVSIQPVLRRIFGCSFLPDFDYGKGGRGWRDLWQDCLSLILNNPAQVRAIIINNFPGVRIDGTNATIIGKKPGEFIADRNNISRVWMDHGIWPLLTTLLYCHQSGDLNIFLEETGYFRDHQLSRGREIDFKWRPEDGKSLKTSSSKIYKGTILEHVLIQNLVQFFNVGPHNHIRLENADWNDGLDMAAQFGESVAFSGMYAQNLKSLCQILTRLKVKNVLVLKELCILLDSLTKNHLNYSDIDQRHKLLNKYFEAVKYGVSGKKVPLPASELARDLKRKADWITAHIQKSEWLKQGFFNGYYNNDKQRVEGKIKGSIRMTLAGQTFPIMSGIANPEQIQSIFKNARRYLKDSELGGFRLNTDFKKEQLNLGRAFSFVYGDKENGAFFSHMNVMFAYALYTRGFVKEGYEVINSIYNMARDTLKSKIYPCLPEYFNSEGKGMYSYLTGSASWLVLTLLTRVFGVRGEYGDLLIEPKLTAEQFQSNEVISITCLFAKKIIEVRFINPAKKDYGRYAISSVGINGEKIAWDINQDSYLISRRKLLALADKTRNTIEITLG